MTSGAITAWEAGATGRGVKIAVVDSGIDPSRPDFVGRIDPASRDTAGTRGISDEGGHGTAVTAIAAAARDGNGILGVAFDATILSFRTDSPGSCARTGADEECEHPDSAIAAAVDGARLGGARVINISLGGSPPGASLVTAVNAATQAGIIVVVSAGNDGRKPEGAQADPFAGGLVQRTGNGLVIIAGSVGRDADGDSTNGFQVDVTQLSDFSNKAGSLGASYLAALGYRIEAPNIQDLANRYVFSGTSFSAPVISGAVALLAQAFPNLTGSQIVQILFRSANDLGAPGIDEVFGNGSLNITRAFQPMGQTALAGSGIAVSTYNNGALPPASGDAKTGKAVAVMLDEYGRAYTLALGDTVQRARVSERRLTTALGGKVSVGTAAAGPIVVSLTISEPTGTGQSVGLAQLGLSYADSRQARAIAGAALVRLGKNTVATLGIAKSGIALERQLAGDDSAPYLIARDPQLFSGFDVRHGDSAAIRHQLGPVALHLSAERGNVVEDSSGLPHDGQLRSSQYASATLGADTSAGPIKLSLGATTLIEDNTVLGGRFDAALGGGSGADSLFVDVAATAPLGQGWAAKARYRRGWTNFAGAGGSLVTEAFSFDLGKSGMLRADDRFGLRVSQPLRVARGGLALNLANSYDYSTLSAGYGLTTINMAPEGRALDFEAAYGVMLGDAWLGANGFYRKDPGHRAGTADDLGAAIRLSFGF